MKNGFVWMTSGGTSLSRSELTLQGVSDHHSCTNPNGVLFLRQFLLLNNKEVSLQ